VTDATSISLENAIFIEKSFDLFASVNVEFRAEALVLGPALVLNPLRLTAMK